jgi:hypothetical protein
MILIDNNYHQDIIRILSLCCINIQKNIDISPDYINEILKNKQLELYIKFVWNQLYLELYSNKNNNEIMQKNNGCGKIIKIHNNSIIEFCNGDRYLHINENIEKQIDNVIDHLYVYKSDENIKKEQLDSKIITSYQKYLDDLYYCIYNILIYYIYDNTRNEIINIYNFDKIKSLYNETKINKNIFKEKYLTINNNHKYIKVYYK